MDLPVRYSKLTIPQKREVRLAYIEQQGGKCFHCDGSLDEEPPAHIMALRVTPDLYPRGFFTHPVHLHHDHDTDLTLGAVHCHCNAVLWEWHGQ
jgi:hypothetical protein